MLTGKLYCPESEYNSIQPKPILSLRFFSFPVVLTLYLFLSISYGQQRGVYKPGDVLFEKPLEKFDLPEFHDNFVIFQDSKGFMWFGHKDGLNRYDGYELKEFMKTPMGNDDLSSPYARIMAEDEKGNIWIGCNRKRGLFRYDPRTEKFLKFPRPGIDPETIDDTEIWSVLPDQNGNVWVGTTGYGGGYPLFKYSYETDSFKEYLQDSTDANSIPSHQIFSSYLDEFNNIWFGCQVGLIHFNPESEKFTFFELYREGGEPIPIRAFDIKEDGKGNLWLFNNPESPDTIDWFLVKISDRRDLLMNELDTKKSYFKDYKTYHFKYRISEFDFDLDSNIWLTSPQLGIFLFNTSSETWDLFRPDPDNRFSISPNITYINGLFCDTFGEIWFGTNGGIQRFAHKKQKFTLFDHQFFGLLEKLGLSINSAYEDPKGILWIASDIGLHKYDPLTKNLLEFKPHLTGNNVIRHLLPDNNDKLYCSGYTGLYIFDMKKEVFSTIPYPFTLANPDQIIWPYCMIQDRRGLIWIGANPGCIRIDIDKKISEFIWEEVDTVPYNTGVTFSNIEDTKGNLWFGTEFGVNYFNPTIESIIPIKHNTENPDGLAAPQISSLLQDHKGNMWVGTRSNGLSYLDASYIDGKFLDPDSLKFKHYSKSDGLPDLHIRGLIEDENGNIWIATYNGIARLDPKKGTYISYDKSDGIDIERFDRNFTRNPLTGRIYLGGTTGLISFHPDSIPINTFVPPIVLTDFVLNNKPVPISDTTVLKQSISYTEHIDLSYKENFLEFEFAALDFTNPEENQYKYYMQGVDLDTVFSGTRRTAEYRDLKPGDYTFWVTGSNNDGIWNNEGIDLSITIHPPWYGANIAYAGYGVAILILLLGILKWRTYSLLKERKTLMREVESRTEELKNKNVQIRELDQLKTRFFTDISHEIRTPLSLILGPIDNLMNEQGESYRKKEWLELIKRNGQRLMHLIDQLLDITRLDEGKMSLILIEENIIQYLRVLINEFQSMAEAKNIKYVVDIPEKEYVNWYDRDKLTKIVTNLITNAIKFTPEDKIVTCRIKILRSKLHAKPDFLKIIIADTGIGISNENLNNIFTRFYRGREAVQESARGTGIGLSLVKELVEILHGKLRVKSRPKNGTIFIVEIPLGLDHLKNDEFVFKELKPDLETDEIQAESVELMNGENNISEEHDKYEILIIEDNLDLREFIKEVLTPAYNILVAENGDEGLNLAFERIPDLILTDIMMPGIDGIELCSRIKLDERTSHIPVIMLTARSTIEQKIEGLETGADDYITKPFKIEELTSRIHNLLEQRDKLRKKFSSLIGFDFDDIEINSRDEKYLKKITGIIDENMGDFEFDVGRLQEDLGISRVHLYRKLKALTGMSPSELIRTMRLKMASKLLQQNNRNVTTIAFKVGFSNPSYFAKCFKEHFGVSPKEYSKKSST